MTFEIPFSSLGLSGKPANGTTWGLAVVVHDRDGSTLNTSKTWPESINESNPSTWGRLNFGMPAYSAPSTSGNTQVTIRNKLNGATVTDAGVGGDLNNLCPGSGLWDNWGNRNFANQDSVNIQNQNYVGDWPCFSKFYITFPLNQVPAGKVIVSAKLVMHEWGGSDFSQAKPSLVQIFSLNSDWSESSITWNNAPMALENVSHTWVNPMTHVIQPSEWPGLRYEWDVSRAVAQAYGSGASLRLALYTADEPFHSGKFFSTSNTADWNANGRPTLIITWGNP